jgi:hypothetical protein
MFGLGERNVMKKYATVIFVTFFIIATLTSFTILNSNISGAYGETADIASDGLNQDNMYNELNYEDEEVGYAELNYEDERAGYLDANYGNESVAYEAEDDKIVDVSHIEKNYMAALEEFLMGHEIFFVNPWGTFLVPGARTEDRRELTHVVNPMTGERIYDAPYILEDGYFRFDFTLFDIDENGTPEILITTGFPESCAILIEVFMYSGGEYSFVGTLLDKSLFKDIRGNLIQYCGWSEMVFDVKFDGLTLQRELFIWHIDGDFRRLFNFRTEQFFDDAFHMNFFTHLDRFEEIDAFPYGPVTRILPLTDLQEHITEIVTNRLLEEGRILREWIRS